MMSALIGCTNAISKKIGKKMAVNLGEMSIEMSHDFNRLVTMLPEEIELPFDNVVLDISVKTDGTPEQIDALKYELEKCCPVAKVSRTAGMTITENWTAH
jgi:uncharacterized OsmC-like protein